MVALTNKIREFRFKNGEMTQKQLAECVGISRQTMNAIENGRHAPTVDLAIRIADVFCVSVDQLFDLDYEGRLARRAKATPIPAERPQVTIDESIEIDAESDLAVKEADMKTRLANLRNVIG